MKFKCSRGRPALTVAASAILVVELSLCGCSSSDNKKPTPVTSHDAGPGAKSTWTNQGYDVRSTWSNPVENTITTANVANLTELWSVKIGASYGTPVVVDNVVYTPSSASVLALDADTGAKIWETGTDTPIGASSSLAYDNGVIFVNGSAGGTVYALDAKTGNINWSTQYETYGNAAGFSSPIVVGDYIVVGNSSGEEFVAITNAKFKGSVVALDKLTGALKWNTHTANDTENGCGVWGSISADVSANLIYAATGNNYTEVAGPGSDSVFAFNIGDGTVKWHNQVTQGDVYTTLHPVSKDTDFGTNPVVFDVGTNQLVAVGQKSGDFYVMDRMTGNVVSHRNLGGGSALPGGMFQGLAWDGTHIITACNNASSTADGGEAGNGLSSGVSTLFALDPLTADIVWERQLPAYVWGPITLANGVGFTGVEESLEAFDLKSGKKLAEWKTNGTIAGGPSIVNGRLYFPSGLSFGIAGHVDGQLHALAFK